MTSIEEADAWIGRTAVDHTGQQIGRITQIWADDTTGQPDWASVKVPELRGREAIVPLAGAAPYGGGRQFAYSKAAIVKAPQGAQEDRLDRQDMDRLSSYYGAPRTDGDPEAATWVGRLEEASDGATVREITALRGGDPAPRPNAPAAPKSGRRFRRKSSEAPKSGSRFRRKSSEAPKSGRRFRRKSAHSEQ